MGMKQIFVMMAAVVLVGCGKDNPDDLIPVRVVSSAEIANELFVEAVALIARADNTNGLVAVDLYEQGLGKVREIVGDHSKTDLAVKIVNGQTVFTNREFDRIVTRMENLKSGEVKFGDPGIEKTVRSLINKPRGVIYGAEVTGIINLATDPRGYQHFNVTEAGLKDVAKLPNLKELRIRDSEELTAEGLKELAKLQKLTSLNLESPRITDAGLKELAKLQNLTSLDLWNTQITDAGLKDVAKLKNLTDLRLRKTKITDEGLKDVAKLQKLTTLYLGSTKITDAGLKDVAKLQKLEELCLSSTKITDAGLKEVAKLRRLEKLYLGETKLTYAGGLAELYKALPNCFIEGP